MTIEVLDYSRELDGGRRDGRGRGDRLYGHRDGRCLPAAPVTTLGTCAATALSRRAADRVAQQARGCTGGQRRRDRPKVTRTAADRSGERRAQAAIAQGARAPCAHASLGRCCSSRSRAAYVLTTRSRRCPCANSASELTCPRRSSASADPTEIPERERDLLVRQAAELLAHHQRAPLTLRELAEIGDEQRQPSSLVGDLDRRSGPRLVRLAERRLWLAPSEQRDRFVMRDPV